MLHQPVFDIIIIGAGPAGLTAALRLCALNYRIAIVEQAKLPRAQIGESLSPGVQHLFDYMNVLHLLQHPAYLSNITTSVIWETQTPATGNNDKNKSNIVVNRAVLDAGLLQEARARGACLYNQTTIQSKQFREGVWELTLQQAGNRQKITAAVILDARGRKSVALADRFLLSPPSLAIWADLPHNTVSCTAIVEAQLANWLWSSCIPGNRYRIMSFLDADSLIGKSPGEFLQHNLTTSALIQKKITSSPIGKVNTCPVYTYVHTQAWQKNYIRLGEAAFGIDPLSSSGVEKAIRFSLQAAIAVNTLLKEHDEALAQEFYEYTLIEAAATHSVWAQQYYQTAWCCEQHTFWKSRAGNYVFSGKQQAPFGERVVQKMAAIKSKAQRTAPADIAVSSVIQTNWYRKVQLASALQWVDACCITGDVVQRKQAAWLPGWERPMAYINNIEMKPLLAMISQPVILRDLVEQWSQHLPFMLACKIIAYIWSEGLLEGE